jgi:DNA-binding LytR/AlgR family response regulator
MNNFGMLFLRKAFIIERTMYPINKSIAKQCKPTSFIIHHSSFIADLTGGLL